MQKIKSLLDHYLGVVCSINRTMPYRAIFYRLNRFNRILSELYHARIKTRTHKEKKGISEDVLYLVNALFAFIVVKSLFLAGHFHT